MLNLFPGSDQEEARPGKLQTPLPPTPPTPFPSPALSQAFPFTDPKLSRPVKSQRNCQGPDECLWGGVRVARAGLSGGSQGPEEPRLLEDPPKLQDPPALTQSLVNVPIRRQNIRV